MQEQTDYVEAVIAVIQKLYSKEKKVILIGHSMVSNLWLFYDLNLLPGNYI